METIDTGKINNLIDLIDKMIYQLTKHSSIKTHQHIDESFYLQKITELRLLGDQLEQARKHTETLQGRVNEHYRHVYCQWEKDAEWLADYITSPLTPLQGSGEG